VLEFTPEQEGNVQNIPWPDMLAGGVKVTDFQYVSAPMSEQDAMIKGMNDCISVHEFDSDEIALNAIISAAAEKKDVPEEITLWEPMVDVITDAEELMEHIESFANGYIGRYTPLNVQSTLTGVISPVDVELEKLRACANALLALYHEVSTNDCFNPNLEGPENDAEEGAKKALEDAGLL